MSLSRLREAVRLCSACPLGQRRAGVPGMWVLNNDPTCTDSALSPPETDVVMVLGEAPGGVEQAIGKPFVGGSGTLLHSLFKETGLHDYYVSNIAKHQPFQVKGKQQAPDATVIKACGPFLKQEFALIKPAKLILLGKTAAKLVCEGNFSMGKVVNQTYQWGYESDSTISVLVLYHPAHFLYNRTAPWIQTQLSAWKRAVRGFMGDRPPEYRVEKVPCPAHPHCCGSEVIKTPG